MSICSAEKEDPTLYRAAKLGELDSLQHHKQMLPTGMSPGDGYGRYDGRVV